MAKDKFTILDKDIREPLFDYIEEHFGKSRIFEEKTMGRSRADLMVVLEDSLLGIEIKSDADSYVRLKSQVKDYDDYFDRNLIVVGSSHAAHVAEHVPDYWGIITVEESADGSGLDFYLLRELAANPNIKPELKLSLLWRPEMAHIQELNYLCAYKSKSKAWVRDMLLSHVALDTLNRQISDELFERDYSTIADRINEYRVNNGQKKRRRKKKRRTKVI